MNYHKKMKLKILITYKRKLICNKVKLKFDQYKRDIVKKNLNIISNLIIKNNIPTLYIYFYNIN